MRASGSSIFHARKFGLLAIGLPLAFAMVGCSIDPVSKGRDQYYGVVDDTYAYVKNAQVLADKGQFVAIKDAQDRISAKLARSECYRISSAATQWGLFEPEVLFLGESVTRSGARAYIFVPPILDGQATFPSPKDDSAFTVFRVDQDTPLGPKLIEQLQLMTGHKDLCIRLARTVRPEKTAQDYAVIAAQVIESSSATPVPTSTPAPALTAPPVPPVISNTATAPTVSVPNGKGSLAPLPGPSPTAHH